MIDVVIPYIRGEAQGNELELAINGWLRHFKEEHRITVVGDHHPCIEKYGPQVDYIGCDRLSKESFPYQYLPHIDITRKLDMFCMLRSPERFIFTADDVYAVQDFDLNDLRIPKYISEGIPVVSQLCTNQYALDLSRTHALLRDERLPERCYETHMPELFERRPFQAIVRYYNMLEVSRVIGDMYHNIVRPMAPRKDLSTIAGQNEWILNYGLAGPSVYEVIADVKAWGPIWLNNGTEGWSKGLEDYLTEHYKLT